MAPAVAPRPTRTLAGGFAVCERIFAAAEKRKTRVPHPQFPRASDPKSVFFATGYPSAPPLLGSAGRGEGRGATSAHMGEGRCVLGNIEIGWLEACRKFLREAGIKDFPRMREYQWVVSQNSAALAGKLNLN